MPSRAVGGIAVLTEGEGEYATLRTLYAQIHQRTARRLRKPIRVNVHPRATPGVIARATAAALRIERANGAERAILLLDREHRAQCPGRIAGEVATAVARLGILPVDVVLKDRTYENWLIADPEALAAQGARFVGAAAVRRVVVPNKADACDAEVVLKKATSDGTFHKVQDARRICDRATVERMGRNSRSFRHFLHVVEYRTKAFGCRSPDPG